MKDTSRNCCGENENFQCVLAAPQLKSRVDHREELYLELFYDLVIVAVFIRLGVLLKYEPTGRVLWIVATLYACFWSSWTLLTHYITLIDQDDSKHRIFYISHIFSVFVTAIYISNSEENTY